eukprot:9290309-Alexandrium_andersonii.AAC.1
MASGCCERRLRHTARARWPTARRPALRHTARSGSRIPPMARTLSSPLICFAVGARSCAGA